MRFPLGSLINSMLLPVVLASSGNCFSQDKDPLPEADQKPSKKGQSEIVPKPTAPILSAQVIQQSVTREGRSIVATGNDGEKVEITDVNGKNITLKHTQVVNGKNVTKEYQADDLAALKAKSPEAASLYEKYTTRPAAPPQAWLRFQVPNQVPQPIQQRLISGDEVSTNMGPRKIRVELEDRKIEIFDSADESILLKVIKTVDGRDQTEEFTADNLWQFKNRHPEAYLLYKKFTGLKAD